MKRASIAVAALAALLLTGCAGTVEEPAAEPRGFVQSVPSETPQPLVAETPTADPDEADEKFLKYVHDELMPDTGIANASDEQLITAGHRACEIIREGTTPLEDIRLVKGERPAVSGYYSDTSAILSGAQYHYCPETIWDPEEG